MAAIDETLDPRGAVLHDPTRSPAVELRDTTVVYQGGNVGLDGASVTIGRGEFAFLVGQTGCGKTTFIRLLLREIEPARGKVLIAGRDIAELPRKKVPKLRRNIGVVFQDFKLLPNRTVYDNVAYSLHGDRGVAVEHQVEGARDPAAGRPVDEAEQLPGRALRRGAAARVARAGVREPARRCCSRTSRPATSTPRPRSGSCS